jgi:hypothetical protein
MAGFPLLMALSVCANIPPGSDGGLGKIWIASIRYTGSLRAAHRERYDAVTCLTTAPYFESPPREGCAFLRGWTVFTSYGQ